MSDSEQLPVEECMEEELQHQVEDHPKDKTPPSEPPLESPVETTTTPLEQNTVKETDQPPEANDDGQEQVGEPSESQEQEEDLKQESLGPNDGTGEDTELIEEAPPKPKVLKEQPQQLPEEPSPTSPGPTPSSHIYNLGWSKLPREVVVDKVKGVIYGQAIGDAFGLATEFMSRKMAQKVYGKGGPSSYSEIAQDFHRMRWTQGDWTDDTDQMLLILHGMVENNGKVDRTDFARRIQHWMQHGFEELGDYGGMGIGMTVHRTLSHYDFLKDPHSSAKHVWESSGRYLAANGAIMRTSVLGILNFNDLQKVIENTEEICKCTHADPRCAASCIAVTVAIALMLQGAYNPMKSNELSSMIEICLMNACKVLLLSDQTKEIREHVLASSIEKLKLDDEKTIGYTFKALGAGFYGLRQAKNFRDTIKEVIMQAGDADSNGAVCGALMGCKFGFNALPEDLLQFPHRQWLDAWVDRFLKTIGLLD